MRNKTKSIIYIGLFVILMLGAGILYKDFSNQYKKENSLFQSPTNEESKRSNVISEENIPDETKRALDFTVYDSDGNEVKLSDYIGTPIVLNFWASWCPPCKEEMPHFNKVSQEYSNDQLIFLMVDLVDGQRETVEKGKKYIEEKGYTFTVLYDTNQEAAMKYGIRSIPSTLLIDKNGYIKAGVEGSIDEETLRQGVALIYE